VSYGYSAYLFTTVPMTQAMWAFVFYCVWLLFIITFVAMMSTFFNSPAFIALISIVILLVCRFIAGLHPFIDAVNPASNSLSAANILMTGNLEARYGIHIIVTLLLVLLMITTMHGFIAKKKF